MKRPIVAVVLAFAFLLPVAPRAGAALCSAPGLTASADRALSPRLREVTLDSTALGRATKIRVLLPEAYESSAARYPVLFLLHGAGDDQSTWTTNTDAEALTATTGVIVVMPDAGKNANAGWYSDWQDGPAWESYHIGELVGYVDACYRVAASPAGRPLRGVAGLSMGGFGAMSYAARHPDLFVVAGSFSGAVDSTGGGPAEAAVYGALHDQFGTPNDKVWGSYADNEVRWRAHNPVDLSSNLRGMSLWLSTGNGVPMPGDAPAGAPVEAGVYSQNVSLHTDLVRKEISHEWRDRGYGVHSWNYWQADLHAFLPYAMARFADASIPVRPASFDYRFAEPSSRVHGYRFSVTGRAMEFSDLTRVGPGGLVARGSGTLEVTTPRIYTPGRVYRVENRYARASDLMAPTIARVDVPAEADGSLRFAVDMGAPHTTQQYTLDGRLAELTGGPDYSRTTTVTITAI